MLFEAGLCLFGVAERHATLWIAGIFEDLRSDKYYRLKFFTIFEATFKQYLIFDALVPFNFLFV